MSSNDIALYATTLISQYPVKKRRTDMSSQEYTQYKYDWDTFNRIWIYSFTIETLNKNASAYGPYGPFPLLDSYQFTSQDELIAYTNGLLAHTVAYPDSSIFTTPPIDLSTFNSLSTLYGIQFYTQTSTMVGISTSIANLAAFNSNLSTLSLLSSISSISSISTLSLTEISTLNSILSPVDRSTFYSLAGMNYLSTVLNNVSTNTFPSTILPVGISTVGFFVSSFVLSLDTPSTFCSFLTSSFSTISMPAISTLRGLTTLVNSNAKYSYFPPPNVSTFVNLSTTSNLNPVYSYFSPAQINTLQTLSNTFLYPPSRLSTYVGLSTLASYSTLYPALTSTSVSTLISLSTIAVLSTVYPTPSLSNLSTLFFISTRVALYDYLSTASLQLSLAQASTFYTLSSYSYFLPPL